MAKVVGVDQSRFKRCTCNGCASIIEYTMNEVSRCDYKDYDGTSDTNYSIACPKCGKSVTVYPYARH